MTCRQWITEGLTWYTKKVMKIKTIADHDPWLEPYRAKLEQQQAYLQSAEKRILGKSTRVEDFALGHLYFGLHKTASHWVFREWAPNATSIYLLCEANGWKDTGAYRLSRSQHGVWELQLPLDALSHGDHYKLRVHWPEGSAERIPSYATYVVQDPATNLFDAVVWSPQTSYEWKHKTPEAPAVPLIYEAHVGMSSEKPEVATYQYFKEKILPRIKELGYNTVQLMAIQEHPYYGSFGYHVSNFFAASSRFGTPDDLKQLIDTAHGMGLRVIMDIVHSHAVKNENEGLSRFDGTLTQYFHEGTRGNHDAWDSRVFDYGKPEVAHFLLSNIRFWLDEYHFDGFRFDGVTSMLYHDHGLERAFGSYDDYVSDNIDLDALAYLRMAAQLAHIVQPQTTIIAEDMSAFPGLACPADEGGIGFNYRLSMGVPDLWIKTLKEKRDEDWELGHLFHELTAHRPEESTISYAESHDQALVGDKTLIFRLIDKDMYDHMQQNDENLTVERGIALHKIIRLLTASTNAGGYLTFMGNEFGHPEWIDFPREGNDWSYHYARRQWSLADNPKLKYQWLQSFDKRLATLVGTLADRSYHYVAIDEDRRLISFVRDRYLFVFNVSPDRSYTDHAIPTFDGIYSLVLSSDDKEYGGHDRVADDLEYRASNEQLLLYLPSRTALVFERYDQIADVPR